MTNRSRFTLAAAFTLLIAAPALVAQTPEASILPVNEPLEVSGQILQPGTYTIRVVKSFTNRNVVQITSQDGQKVYATALTVPHPLEPNEEVPNTKFVFYPAEDGRPRALRTWFAADPAASGGGHDFVYDENRARELARLASSRVVSYPTQTASTEFNDTTGLSVITPEAKVETYTYVPPPTAIAETPAPVVTTPRIEVQTQPTQIAEAQPMEMPRTASRLPLVTLLGLASLAGAIALRVARS